MKEFKGKKFHLIAEYKVKDYSSWWDDNKYIIKKEFELSWAYRKYLKAKRLEERENYISTLKSKLEWQMKEYGEVDEVDFQEYMNYIKGNL